MKNYTKSRYGDSSYKTNSQSYYKNTSVTEIVMRWIYEICKFAIIFCLLVLALREPLLIKFVFAPLIFVLIKALYVVVAIIILFILSGAA